MRWIIKQGNQRRMAEWAEQCAWGDFLVVLKKIIQGCIVKHPNKL